ncbi:MAG: DUF3164 family protein [Desulfobulbaceae bacterium]|nr:DUF3164 family protein [Desulfobulbaceae bacterium]
MATKDKNGVWIDSTGASVPARYIKPIDKKRDAMVERLITEAKRISERLDKLRGAIDVEVEKFLAQSAEDAGADCLNPGGNYIFSNFSGDRRLQIKTCACIDFDERLQFAKETIDKCLDRWSEGGNANLRAVVFDAFKVDIKGQVDVKRILGLRRLKIKDAEWEQAMELISNAITITGRKTYTYFSERPERTGDWKGVRLDL